jgi:hypothetical protein
MNKETRSIFVIMPFSKTPTRDKKALDSFFKFNLKERIENYNDFKYRYIVERSGDTLVIPKKIIKDLFYADIVLCDLSGHQANPNVMYELGIRFSISNKPVILFREDSVGNEQIFDTNTYYTELYSPLRYNELEKFIVEKILNYEKEIDEYESPVLDILGKEPLIQHFIYKRKTLRKLQMLQFSLHALRAKISGDIVKFLKKNKIENFPIPLDEFGSWFHNEREVLMKFDWNSFKIGFTKSPVIESFLANPEIDFVIPDELRDKFIVYFHTWYDLFLNERDNYEVTFGNIEAILWEIYILNQLVLSLMSYTNGGEQTKKIAYDHFNKTFQQSIIAEYTIESVGILAYIPPRND